MERTNASVSSHRAAAAKPRVNLSMTWDHPSLAEPDNFWDTQGGDDAALSLNYDASASASFQPSPGPTSLSLTAPTLPAMKFPPSYLHVDTDSGSATYTLSDIAPTLHTLTITTTSSEGEESSHSTGGAGSGNYRSSSSTLSRPTVDTAVGSSALAVPCASPLSSSSSMSLPSPPMSPTSSDYTRALRELEELAREEDWMTSASEYESDAEVVRGRERSRSGEKERSEKLLAPRNYISSSLFSSNNTTTTAAVSPPSATTTIRAVLSATALAAASTPAPSTVSNSSSQPSANLPPLPPQKGSAVAFTIQKKPLPSSSSPHSQASPHSLSPTVTTSHTLTANGAAAGAAVTASSSSPSHTRTLSRQARRRTAEPNTVLSRPSSRPDSRAGSRANSPPRGSSPQTHTTSLSAAPPAANDDEDVPLPTTRQMKRGSSSRRRTWNHSAANSQDDSTLFGLALSSRRSSINRNETASPSLSTAASAATSPRASVVSTARQVAQTDSDSLKQRRARRQLSHSWMNSPVSIETGDAGFDSAPLMLTRRRSRSHSRSRSGSRSLVNDPHAIASTSSASSSASAVEPMHRRQLSTPHVSSSCPVLPPMAGFHGEDTRASSLPSPLTPSSSFPLPSPPPLTSPTSLQAQGDKVALVLEGRQIAVLSLAAVQQLLEGHGRGKDDDGDRDGRGSRSSGRRRSAKVLEEADEVIRRNEAASDCDSEDEEDRAARLRMQSQRRRSQKRLSVRTSKADPTVLAALHRREQSIDS